MNNSNGNEKYFNIPFELVKLLNFNFGEFVFIKFKFLIVRCIIFIAGMISVSSEDSKKGIKTRTTNADDHD
jgi:large-conductance mechanosensitive channel